MKRTKGFTLIELLVVIAIIGILSSVVLASLNTARDKGADAAIKSDLAGIRSQAEIYFDTNAHYGADASDCLTAGTLFVDDANIAAAVAHASTTSANPATCLADDGAAAVGTDASSWAVSVPLKTNSATQWCVDSSGASGIGDAVIVSDLAVCQ